jgi:hypothetical protein
VRARLDVGAKHVREEPRPPVSAWRLGFVVATLVDPELELIASCRLRAHSYYGGSMLEPGGTGATKWAEVMNDVNAFVADPASAGVAAAFQLFPQGATAACDGTPYDVPLVAMGPIGPTTQTTQAISAALASRTPGLGPIIQSPIESVLRGATAFCMNHRQSTGQSCHVVFVTDGNPTVCSADTALLAQITGSAYSGRGIQTWLVGVAGTDFVQLNEIALQGGSNCDPSGVNRVCDASSASLGVAALLAYVRDHLGN